MVGCLAEPRLNCVFSSRWLDTGIEPIPGPRCTAAQRHMYLYLAGRAPRGRSGRVSSVWVSSRAGRHRRVVAATRAKMRVGIAAHWWRLCGVKPPGGPAAQAAAEKAMPFCRRAKRLLAGLELGVGLTCRELLVAPVPPPSIGGWRVGRGAGNATTHVSARTRDAPTRGRSEMPFPEGGREAPSAAAARGPTGRSLQVAGRQGGRRACACACACARCSTTTGGWLAGWPERSEVSGAFHGWQPPNATEGAWVRRAGLSGAELWPRARRGRGRVGCWAGGRRRSRELLTFRLAGR